MVECTGLENRSPRKWTEGSNPSASEKFRIKRDGRSCPPKAGPPRAEKPEGA